MIIKERYELIEKIQSGGFGTTYLGMDLMLNMQVAVKEYSGEDEKRKAQFLKEARSLAKFSGEPGIVNVRDFLEENGHAYMVMEFLDGMDLKTYIEENGALSFERTMKLMLPVMKTVEKLHAAGIIHRDISPENIRMLSKGTMKLLDFGSAMDVEVDNGKTMTVMVKPGYAPREQYLSKSQQGDWTDIYALCATMYKCITGETPMDSLQRSFQDELPLPSSLGCEISAQQEAVLMRGMAVDPKERIQTVKELMEALGGSGKAEPEMQSFQSYISEPKLQTAQSYPTEANQQPIQSHPVEMKQQSAQSYPAESALIENEGGRKQSGKPSTDDNVSQESAAPDLEKKRRKRKEEKPARTEQNNKKRKKQSKTGIAKKILIVFAVLVIGIVAVSIYGSDPYRETGSHIAKIEDKTVSSGMIKKTAKDKKATYLSLWNCEVSDERLAQIAKMKYINEIEICMVSLA